jgi:hypothetical protein
MDFGYEFLITVIMEVIIFWNVTLLVAFLFGLIFIPDDGGSTFL